MNFTVNNLFNTGIPTHTSTLTANTPQEHKKIKRKLTDDEICYIKENTGRVAVIDLSGELNLNPKHFKLLSIQAGITLKRCNNKVKAMPAPPFTGERSAAAAQKRGPKPRQGIPETPSETPLELPVAKSLDSQFINPILRVNIETGEYAMREW